MTNRPRVVITGMGAISPFGVGVDVLWDGLSAGHCAIKPTRREAGGHHTERPAAVVTGFVPHQHIDQDRLIFMDPYAQFALAAANLALADAGLIPSDHDPSRIGIVLGTSSGGDSSRELEAERCFHKGKRRCNPALVARTNNQAGAGEISMRHGITGPVFVVNSGCAAGNHAMAQAVLLLRSGLVDRVISGGAEACVLYSTMKAFEAMGALAGDTCRPFSAERGGLVLGEGAGLVVLETLAAARERGAPIHAELAGIGMSADAADAVQPTAHGPAQAMNAALHDAQLSHGEIGYISAHGTGTRINDRVETQAVHRCFGSHASKLAISSTKSMLGHSFGAAGGLELIACVKAIQRGIVPPTVNYLGPDPNCDLDVVPNRARHQSIDAALSNAFAIGGLNAVLAVRRY